MKDNTRKFSAKLVKGGNIEITADANTVLTRKVRDSDKEDWPELFKKKATAKKAPKKDAVINDSLGDDKPSG